MTFLAKRCLARIVSLAAVLLLCSGCGSKLATVAGTVTLDGEPVENGAITFVPDDGNTASAGAVVVKGQYSVEMPPGKKVVQITAPKVIGQRQAYEGDPNSPMMDIVSESIPERYNAQSKLLFEAKPGRNSRSFDLSTD